MFKKGDFVVPDWDNIQGDPILGNGRRDYVEEMKQLMKPRKYLVVSNVLSRSNIINISVEGWSAYLNHYRYKKYVPLIIIPDEYFEID